MTRIEQLEMAVSSLPQEEYIEFRRWFLDRDWEKWDRGFQAETAASRDATAELLKMPGMLDDVKTSSKQIKSGRLKDWRKVRDDL